VYYIGRNSQKLPKIAISEYFLRVILRKNYNNLHIGSGIRYYNSSQRKIGANPAEFDFKFVSTAPEDGD